MSEFWVKLRGLPYRTTMDDIVEFLTDINIKGGKRGINFPISQKNIEWGEAFIEFESEEEMEKAKAKHNQHMGRRYIEVFTSSKADMELACKQQKGAGVVNGRERNVQKRGISRSPVRERMTENYVVRMKGLPFNASKADIKDFFQGLKILPDGMSILVDQNGKALGDAFVQFASYHDAKLSKERTGNKIGHRYIEVFDSNIEEANSEIRRQMEINDMRVPQFEKSPPRSRGGRSFDEPPYTESRRYSRPSPLIVNMRGVSISVRPDDVFRFFRPLLPLSIVMKFTSVSDEGDVDVEFASEEEVFNAMTRDRERLGDSHVSLSVVPLREEFPQFNDSISGPNYERREREVSRGRIPPNSAPRYSDRESMYPPSRYY